MDSEQRQNVCVAVDLLRDHVCKCVCLGEQGLYALSGRTSAKEVSHALLIHHVWFPSLRLLGHNGISYFCCRAIAYEPLYWQTAVLFLPSK